MISAFNSPLARKRAFARIRFPANFHEVCVRASLADCEARGPKWLYRRALLVDYIERRVRLDVPPGGAA